MTPRVCHSGRQWRRFSSEGLGGQRSGALGGLDILVNSVGIARVGALAEMPLADIDTLLNVNVRAALLESQATIAYLPPGGRIISIGSNVAERLPFGGLTKYAVTKSALLAFTCGLARELGPRNITVNLVQSGPIDTELNPVDGAAADLNRSLTALDRYGTPADIGNAVAFLASPSANYMTRSVLTVDGGFNA